jgi:predicted dinucleotide-binding enzyme
MRIGIIGSGHVGSTLSRLLVKAGHEVTISHSGDPAALDPLVQDLGPGACATTPAEAVRFGDVVVVAIPFGRIQELPIAEFDGKIVVDANNYYPDRDGHVPELDEDRTTSSEMLQRELPNACVVKAFNTILWDRLRDHGDSEKPSRRPIGIPVAGDDPRAKHTVTRLVESLGFEPLDTGSLAEGGRRQQPGSAVYLVEASAEALRERLGAR